MFQQFNSCLILKLEIAKVHNAFLSSNIQKEHIIVREACDSAEKPSHESFLSVYIMVISISRVRVILLIYCCVNNPHIS